MNCNIDTTPDFAQELKQLAKRYPSIRDDYETFLKELRENPLIGTKLGKKLRKVRFAIASKGNLYFTPMDPFYPDMVHTYAFNIEREGTTLHGIDRRIAATVIDILRRFFEMVENAMIMVCDNTDGKQESFGSFDDSSYLRTPNTSNNNEYEQD